MATSPDIYAQCVRAGENPGRIVRKNVQLKAGVSTGRGFLLVTDAGFGKIPAAGIRTTAKCAGVSLDNQDNSAGADGDITVGCESEVFIDCLNSGSNPCSQADVGTDIYAEDHQTIGNLNTAGCLVGSLEEFNPIGGMPGRPCRIRVKAT